VAYGRRGVVTNQVLGARMLSSRTFGARTLASPLCWALWQLQPTSSIIHFCALALLTVFAIPLCALSSSPAAEQPREKNVLVLFSAVQYSQSTLELIEPPMRARVPGPITFYDAYLEDPQVEEKSYRESVSETLRRRYAKVKLDGTTWLLSNDIKTAPSHSTGRNAKAVEHQRHWRVLIIPRSV
jgi:hypothetical protein